MAIFQQGTKAEEAGYRLFGFDQVGSTNVEALDFLKAGDPGKVWFAALQQTQGKGRRGRTWVSPHGNLAASLLVTFDTGGVALAGLGFVAGVSLITALEKVLPEGIVTFGQGGIKRASTPDENAPPTIALKWPNDVLANGAKLSGILLESHVAPDGRQGVIVGIGVNVVAAPEGLDYPTASLANLGFDVSAPAVFEALANAWVDIFDIWDYGKGLADVLDIWRFKATGFGAKIAVNTPTGIIRGVFQDIDDEGRLLVRQDDGTSTTISAGDVHFGGVASIKD